MIRKLLIVLLCLPLFLGWADTEQALRDAGARDWEVLAAQTFQVGSSMSHLRQLHSVVRSDCGAFGVFHLQPRQAEALGITTESRCPVDDPKWVIELEAFLKSSQGVEFQLTTWRRIVGHVVRRAGSCSTEEKAAIATMANSSPTRTIDYGEMTGWDVERMLYWYIYDRPTAHRYRRVNYVREEILGIEPLNACVVIDPLTI